MSLKKLLPAALGVLLACALHTPAHAQGQSVTVFAAASLKTALDDIAAQWQKETGKTARISYAASGPLAKQIEVVEIGLFLFWELV